MVDSSRISQPATRMSWTLEGTGSGYVLGASDHGVPRYPAFALLHFFVTMSAHKMMGLLGRRTQRSLTQTLSCPDLTKSAMRVTSLALRSMSGGIAKDMWTSTGKNVRISTSIRSLRSRETIDYFSSSAAPAPAVAALAAFSAVLALILDDRFVGSSVTLAIPQSYIFFPGNRQRTSCESTETPKEQESDEGADPYDNLPDEDEETQCSMCNTFRKGPCRPFWRKLEHCFKDHESEENGAVKCMKYFSPHQSCLQKYLNLYQLVSLDMKQQLVVDTELSVRDDERRDWENAFIDWGMLTDFVKDQGLAFRQTIRRRTDDSDETSPLLPLWQRLPEDTEPVLLTVSSKVPQRRDGMILKIAFAVDQDGFVLGLSYNSAYQALLDEANRKTEADGGTGSKDAASPEVEPAAGEAINSPSSASSPSAGTGEDPFTLEFFLLPGETKAVRLSALYSESPVGASPDKELLDVLLCTSRYFPVADAGEPPSKD